MIFVNTEFRYSFDGIHEALPSVSVSNPTIVVVQNDGKEHRVKKVVESVHEFSIDSIVYTTEDAISLMDFYEESEKNLQTFKYRNPLDYRHRSPGQVVLNPSGELDSSVAYGMVAYPINEFSDTEYQIYRTYTAGNMVGYKTITKIDLSEDFEVYIDGVLLDPANYTLLENFGKVLFNSPPTGDVTIACYFFYHVRFNGAFEISNRRNSRYYEISNLRLKEVVEGGHYPTPLATGYEDDLDFTFRPRVNPLVDETTNHAVVTQTSPESLIEYRIKKYQNQPNTSSEQQGHKTRHNDARYVYGAYNAAHGTFNYFTAFTDRSEQIARFNSEVLEFKLIALNQDPTTRILYEVASSSEWEVNGLSYALFDDVLDLTGFGLAAYAGISTSSSIGTWQNALQDLVNFYSGELVDEYPAGQQDFARINVGNNDPDFNSNFGRLYDNWTVPLAVASTNPNKPSPENSFSMYVVQIAGTDSASAVWLDDGVDYNEWITNYAGQTLIIIQVTPVTPNSTGSIELTNQIEGFLSEDKSANSFGDIKPTVVWSKLEYAFDLPQAQCLAVMKELIAKNGALLDTSRKYTLCTCIKLEYGGVTKTYTSLDRDIYIGGFHYEPQGGITASAINRNAQTAVDNLDITGLLDGVAIDRNAVISGLFDGARVTVANIDWTNIPDSLEEGEVILRGRVGNVVQDDTTIKLEIRSMVDAFNVSVVSKATPMCTNTLGDSKCGLDLNNLKRPITALANSDSVKNILIDGNLGTDFDLWTNGYVTCTSGANIGHTKGILDANDTNINLIEAFPYIIQAGDTFDCFPACDRTVTHCARFGNLSRFRGFVPSGTGNFMAGKDRLASGN